MHPKGANSKAIYGLSFRNTLVGTRWFCPPVKKWAEKMILSTLWTPIPGSEAFFNSLDEWLLAKSHDYCKLVNGLSHKRVENGCKDSCRKFDG